MKSREILKVLISHILSLYQLFTNFFIKRFVWNWLSDPDRIEFRGQIFSLIFSSVRNFYIPPTMSLFFWTIIKSAANSFLLVLILFQKKKFIFIKVPERIKIVVKRSHTLFEIFGLKTFWFVYYWDSFVKRMIKPNPRLGFDFISFVDFALKV